MVLVCHIGKKIQGLNQCTPNPSVIQSMDWLSLASIIDERRLGIFGRILSLELSSIYKNVAIISMCQRFIRANRS